MKVKRMNYKRKKGILSIVQKYNNISFYKFLIKVLIFILIVLILFMLIHFISFDHNKVKLKETIKYEKVVDENIVFLGDSITNRYDLNKYFPNNNTVNSGVEANRTNHILDDMYNRVYKYNPSKVFILIGINQVTDNSVEEIVDDIKKIVKKIHKNRKFAKVYIISIYPIDSDREGSLAADKSNKKVEKINSKLRKLSSKLDYTYIDVYSKLIDGESLKDEYSIDGLHLSDKGYEIVTKTIKKHVKG